MGGQRACIGFKFAEMELSALLFFLLSRAPLIMTITRTRISHAYRAFRICTWP